MQQMFIFNNISTCFGHRTVTFTVLTPYKAAPRNRYQPHPAEPAQHATCSNTRLVLLKMGIMMPETCGEIVKNKHLLHLVGFLYHFTIPETVNVSKVHSVAAVLYLQSVLHVTLFRP